MEVNKIILRKDYVDVLYVESYGNYIKVHRIGGGLTIHRSSLATLDSHLDPNVFLRIHQKYVLNLWKVENFKGNAQGYYVHLKESNDVIKVSRKYVKVFVQMMQKINHPDVVMTRNDPGYLFM